MQRRKETRRAKKDRPVHVLKQKLLKRNFWNDEKIKSENPTKRIPSSTGKETNNFRNFDWIEASVVTQQNLSGNGPETRKL